MEVSLGAGKCLLQMSEQLFNFALFRQIKYIFHIYIDITGFWSFVTVVHSHEPLVTVLKKKRKNERKEKFVHANTLFKGKTCCGCCVPGT